MSDDASSTIYTPPESVVDETFEEVFARDRLQIEKDQKFVQELAANGRPDPIHCLRVEITGILAAFCLIFWAIYCSGTIEFLAVSALALSIVLTVEMAARCFGAMFNNTTMPSKSVNQPIQTVATTITATATINATATITATATMTNTAAVTAQPSAPPTPGNVYVIHSVSCRQIWSGTAITHLDNEVLLTTPSDRSSHWLVVEKNGWLGFMNAQSGRYLGHDGFGKLRCSAREHKGWETFHFQPGGRQGQVLLMPHWDRLVPVGAPLHDGKAGLRMLVDGIAGGLVWEFVKVEP